MTNKRVCGFTIVEILVVIVVLALLGGIVFFALDPGRRFGESRDATRWEHVNVIHTAVIKYQIDNDGDLPPGIDSITETVQVLGTNSSGCEMGCDAAPSTRSCLHLVDLIDEYMSEIPKDPKIGTDGFCGYYINRDETGHLTVGACSPEQQPSILVTK